MYIIFINLRFSRLNSMKINIVTQVFINLCGATKFVNRIRCEYILQRAVLSF